ncbi:MAG: hypothetical protein E7583_09815 [Ruminococcaceae bacterium]|nr:hypothetical protein [Oscillospiraceae bacterium]
MGITETSNSIIFENKYTIIEVSKTDASVIAVTDKVNGKSIKGEDCHFFSALENDKETDIIPTRLKLSADVITVSTKYGSFDVRVKSEDEYFTFELITELPKDVFLARIAHAKYSYDFNDKNNTGACGIAMTYWANPCFFPDSKDMETKAEIVRHLKDIGAKYALIIAPINQQKDIIKSVCKNINPEYGLVSEIGGAYGRDSRLNFGNYIMVYHMYDQYLEENLELLKSMGVDQVDVHKRPESTFRSGDFKYAHYKDGADFKKRVSDVLEKHGMTTGLHTYACFIDYLCEDIVTDPECQKDLMTLETFTLSEDIDENCSLIPTLESTADVSMDYAFFCKNSPYLIVDNELIRYDKNENGFTALTRGSLKTKPAPHKKGTPIYHLNGMFNCFAPKIGSELFYRIARNTAKAYNEGGYKMIYLDGLDGIWQFKDREYETWFYAAAFVHEVLKYCNTTPVFEYSAFTPSLWLARGRAGAWDAPFREYKAWNKYHANYVKNYTDCYLASTLGWYLFYPLTDAYPGNEHTKYQHTDAAEHIGSLALMHDFGIVYTGNTFEDYKRVPALRRNIDIFKRYDNLRKQGYFTKEYREKLLNGEYEYHLKENSDGSFCFVEKDYKTKRLCNLGIDRENRGTFTNPFGEQTPFIRIEALLSSKSENPIVLLPLDINMPLTSQTLSAEFEKETDLSAHIAKKVTVRGNGKEGGAIAIIMRCGTNSEKGYAIYIIDTDFVGEREFLLIEADNGNRKELGFEEDFHIYAVYRSGFKHERASKIYVETRGDMTGVAMSDVVAVNHTYDVLKNPTVKIGDTSVVFDCELMSTDFIEYDGKSAKVIDRYGNEKTVTFSGDIIAPSGEFAAELTAKSLNGMIPRAQLTFGFCGKEIK